MATQTMYFMNFYRHRFWGQPLFNAVLVCKSKILQKQMNDQPIIFIVCKKCHDHIFMKWKQSKMYTVAIETLIVFLLTWQHEDWDGSATNKRQTLFKVKCSACKVCLMVLKLQPCPTVSVDIQGTCTC